MAPDGQLRPRREARSLPQGLDGIVAVLLSLALVLLVALPAAAVDSDGDGLRDGFESRYGVTDPHKRDSDGDGVIDSAEDNDGDKLGNLGEQRFGTNPRKRDSDRDGTPDGREDKDRDGRSNAREQDQRPLPSGLWPTLKAAPKDIPDSRGECLTKAGNAWPRRCEFGDTASDTTIVLMGDSHALMWLRPFAIAAEREGWKLVTFFKGGCTPVLATMSYGQYVIDGGRTCRRWRLNVHTWLNEHPPELFVLAHADSYRIVDNKGRTIPSKDRPAIWQRGLTKSLAAIPAATEVLVFGDVPKNVGNPIKCLKGSKSNISACVTKKEFRAQRTIENALRAAAAAGDAQFRTLYGKICSYDPCPLVQGDVLMWRDKGHLTKAFTKRLTPSVRSLLVGVMGSTGTARSARR